MTPHRVVRKKSQLPDQDAAGRRATQARQHNQLLTALVAGGSRRTTWSQRRKSRSTPTCIPTALRELLPPGRIAPTPTDNNDGTTGKNTLIHCHGCLTDRVHPRERTCLHNVHAYIPVAAQRALQLACPFLDLSLSHAVAPPERRTPAVSMAGTLCVRRRGRAATASDDDNTSEWLCGSGCRRCSLHGRPPKVWMHSAARASMLPAWVHDAPCHAAPWRARSATTVWRPVGRPARGAARYRTAHLHRWEVVVALHSCAEV